MPTEEDDKLELLTVNNLLMAEVRVFEKMSGYTIQELYLRGQDEPMPTAALMALAYLTEKRVRPGTKRESYENLSYQKLIRLLNKRFTFETVDDADDESDEGDVEENPTPAA